jgi:dihydroorotase
VTDLVLRNGLVLEAGRSRVGDVVVSGARVSYVGPQAPLPHDARVIDCTGFWVGPGFVDLHTHLREPGAEHKEDIASGSAAAAAGGYTAVVAMPNTRPPIDSAEVASFITSKAAGIGLVDVGPSGTLTVGRRGKEIAPFAELWIAGARLFTDDGDTLFDEDVMRQALVEVGRLGGVVCQHAVHPELAGDGQLHAGDHASWIGVAGIPSEAETEIVARDLGLVSEIGTAYHLQHASAAASVDLIAAARAAGLPVSVEVTPHHLAFHSSHVGDSDTNLKVMPPLRSEADRSRLRAGLESGAIDMVATDHAPHAPDEKAVGFIDAPFGVVGLEQAAAVVNTVTRLEPHVFFDRMSVAPARVGRFEQHGRWIEVGGPANLVVFDPEAVGRLPAGVSRSDNNPYRDREWTGRVRLTMLRGRVTFDAVALEAR